MDLLIMGTQYNHYAASTARIASSGDRRPVQFSVSGLAAGASRLRARAR